MGNWVDKLKNMTGYIDPEEEGFETDDFDLEEPEETNVYDTFSREQNTVPANTGKVVYNSNSKAALQVILAKPERFDDVAAIADNLNKKMTVILNLESTERNVSRRIIDFLSGAAYANGGQIKRVANSTFVITPFNVNLSGDVLDELENNGLSFSN
ncbi:MAG: cell division protein SepF [Clostridia bacterium]|nr:cell division protein SepF [Clostridia bacterium]